VHFKAVHLLLVISLATSSLPAVAQLTEYRGSNSGSSNTGAVTSFFSSWDRMRNDVRRIDKRSKSLVTRVNGLHKDVSRERKKLANLDGNVHDLSKRSALLRSQTYTVNSRVNALDKSIESIQSKFRLLELLALMLVFALALFFTFRKWDRKRVRSHRRLVPETKTGSGVRPNPPANMISKNQVALRNPVFHGTYGNDRHFPRRGDRRLLNDMVPGGGTAAAMPVWMKFMSWELSEFDWTADQIIALFELSHPPQSCNSNSDVL